MIVLSHRGYWLESNEKNQAVAFQRSFDLNFGTETDIRDRDGALVISHDIPNGSEISLVEFLQILNLRNLPLALNIKADGLVTQLLQTMQGISNWFVFDMAVPDMYAYLNAGVPVFTCMSEVEKMPVWLQQSAGVWLDAFSDTWFDADIINDLLKSGKQVCVVSSELHGRSYDALWKMLLPISGHPALMLCTDHPELAREFFGESR